MSDRPKMGEADKIGPEPRLGSTQVDAQGRRWRKVRHLGREAWGKALCDAVFYTRIGERPPDDAVRAMGYDLDTA